ncbi:MarR family transcriptional regulator [Paenibacillus paeoniae]|uniref:MarR family transcriptional regulator n=2 Tax=Paenibacillus paeoniae TaxID=2292705 RepID=A0A371P803_9BACL|nr:MarR family transcriptional regulator [Paenibacillus paeoniae]
MFQNFVAFLSEFHQATHQFTKDVRPEGTTAAQYDILEYLMVSQPATLSEVSECVHMSMPNTSREIRKLEEKGLCEKTSDPLDKRKQLIQLTTSGQAIMGQAFNEIEARFMARIQDASPEDIRELEHALQVIRKQVF